MFTKRKSVLVRFDRPTDMGRKKNHIKLGRKCFSVDHFIYCVCTIKGDGEKGEAEESSTAAVSTKCQTRPCTIHCIVTDIFATPP